MSLQNDIDKLTVKITAFETIIASGITPIQVASLMPMIKNSLKDARDVLMTARTRTRDLLQSVVIDAAPLPPVDLIGILDIGTVMLDWTTGAGNGIEGHKVLRNEDGGEFEQIGLDIPTPTVAYSDDTVENDHVYVYKVVAYNATHDSLAADNEITITA